MLFAGGVLILRRFGQRRRPESFPIAGVNDEVSDADRARLADAMREMETVGEAEP